MRISLVLLLCVVLQVVLGAVSDPERDALVRFYNETNGEGWAEKDNWLSGDPCENYWFGLTCNPFRTHVVTISLSRNNLQGTLTNALTNVTQLQKITIAANSLGGPLPSSWSTFLFLDSITADFNHFQGSIPEEWSSMPKISVLSFNRNNFTSLPQSLSPSLLSLYLPNNTLSGTLPSSWGNAQSHLEELVLSYNHLSGTLPEEWSVMPQMIALGLNKNEFTGSLPSSWSNLTLTSLYDIWHDLFS